jgi:hypothetical protein
MAKPLSVVDAVRAELAEIAKFDPKLAEGGRAAGALVLARDLDDPGNSATSHSMCQRALNETLDRLHELAPEKKETDQVDEIGKRRAKRRRRAAAAAD